MAILNPVVKDNSWHYKWWAGTYRIWWSRPPIRFSICPYFWRVVLFSWAILYPLGIVARVIAFPFQLLGMLFNWIGSLMPARPYKPKTYKPPFRERHPRAAEVLKATGWVAGKVFVGLLLLLIAIAIISLLIKEPVQFLLTLGIVAIVAAIIALIIWVPETDTARLVGEFIKAKKARVCPFVTVIRTRS